MEAIAYLASIASATRSGTIEEMLLFHFPSLGILPKMWVWSPSKFFLSKVSMCGTSPAGIICGAVGIPAGCAGWTASQPTATKSRAINTTANVFLVGIHLASMHPIENRSRAISCGQN